MYRRHLGNKSGMWFVFKAEGIYPFWMKNTSIPLDIIWVDGSRRVVDFKRNTTPFSEVPIIPSGRAKWVLEVPAGTVDRKLIAVGDYVQVR
jgi:uncharacterized protein